MLAQCAVRSAHCDVRSCRCAAGPPRAHGPARRKAPRTPYAMNSRGWAQTIGDARSDAWMQHHGMRDAGPRKVSASITLWWDPFSMRAWTTPPY